YSRAPRDPSISRIISPDSPRGQGQGRADEGSPHEYHRDENLDRIERTTMNQQLRRLESMTRRHFLRDCPVGFGGLALALLAAERAEGATQRKVVNPLAPKQPPFKARARSVIVLHMAGSPPHLDMFDYKPELLKRTGQDCPGEFLKGKRFAF